MAATSVASNADGYTTSTSFTVWRQWGGEWPNMEHVQWENVATIQTQPAKPINDWTHH